MFYKSFLFFDSTLINFSLSIYNWEHYLDRVQQKLWLWALDIHQFCQRKLHLHLSPLVCHPFLWPFVTFLVDFFPVKVKSKGTKNIFSHEKGIQNFSELFEKWFSEEILTVARELVISSPCSRGEEDSFIREVWERIYLLHMGPTLYHIFSKRYAHHT